jgi:hypothetical protein
MSTDTDTDTQAAQALRRAANLIQVRGLNKGSFIAPHEPPATASLCALGALHLACGTEEAKEYGVGHTDLASTEVPRTVYYAAYSALSNEIHDPYVQAWNDNPKRTRGEVVNTLRRTADRLDHPTLRSRLRRLLNRVLDGVPWR